MQVDAAVVDARSDPALGQRVEQLVAGQRRFGIERDLIEVACVPRVWIGGRRRPQGQSGEQLVVASPQLGPAIDPPPEQRQLVQPERRLDVGHVELEAGLDHFVVTEAGVREALPRPQAQPVEREPLNPHRQLRVLAD